MTLTRSKIHALSPIFVLGLAAVCAAAPTADAALLRAERALADAGAADAATYAPIELRFASDRLDQARTALAAGDAATAAPLLEESVVNSDLAVAKSNLGKLREAVQAQALENDRLRRELRGTATDGAPR
jgi:hypothetical protein